jgi:hypothetical protein
MLLIASRLLPGAALHHLIRLMMGIPRFGALRNTVASTSTVATNVDVEVPNGRATDAPTPSEPDRSPPAAGR